MKWLFLVFALAIGVLLGNAGHGDAPPLIDSLAGTPRTAVLLLLGLVLFGAVWHFGTAIGRYHKSGDPPTVIRIDQRSGEGVARIPQDSVPEKSSGRG